MTAPAVPSLGRTAMPTARRLPAAELLTPVLLVALVAVVLLRHLAVLYPSDPMSYMEAARLAPDPGPEQLRHQFLRLGIVLPLRAAQQLLGYSQGAAYAVAVASALALTAASYAFARLLVDRLVGVSAALLVLGSSLVATEATTLSVDVLGTALLTAALAVALALHQGRAVVTTTARRRAVALAAVGLLLGWGYLTREYTVLAWPLVPLLLWRRVGARESGWLLGGLGTCAAVELGYGALALGAPLARVRAVLGHGEAEISPALAATVRDLPRSTYLGRLPEVLGDRPEGALLLALLAVAVLTALLRPRQLWPAAVWVLLVWTPLTLFGGLADPSAPRLRLHLERYWLSLLPPLLTAGVAGVCWGARAASRRFDGRVAALLPAAAVLAVTAALLGSAYAGWSASPSLRPNGATHLETLRGWLAGEGSSTRVLWADRRTATLLPVFTVGPWGGPPVWAGEVRRWEPGGAGPAPGDTVVLYSLRTPQVCGHCRDLGLALLEGSPGPAGWDLLLQAADGDLQVWRVGPPAPS